MTTTRLRGGQIEGSLDRRITLKEMLNPYGLVPEDGLCLFQDEESGNGPAGSLSGFVVTKEEGSVLALYLFIILQNF